MVALIGSSAGCGPTSCTLKGCLSGFELEITPPVALDEPSYVVSLDDMSNAYSCELPIPGQCSLGPGSVATEGNPVTTIRVEYRETPAEVRFTLEGSGGALMDELVTVPYQTVTVDNGDDPDCDVTCRRADGVRVP